MISKIKDIIDVQELVPLEQTIEAKRYCTTTDTIEKKLISMSKDNYIFDIHFERY